MREGSYSMFHHLCNSIKKWIIQATVYTKPSIKVAEHYSHLVELVAKVMKQTVLASLLDSAVLKAK